MYLTSEPFPDCASYKSYQILSQAQSIVKKMHMSIAQTFLQTTEGFSSIKG